MNLLRLTATLPLLFGLVALFSGRAPRSRVAGLLALAEALYTLDDIRAGRWLAALVDAAVCAYLAHLWWTGGGGSGTRRRLRALASRFRGVRRTAPAPGGAS